MSVLFWSLSQQFYILPPTPMRSDICVTLWSLMSFVQFYFSLNLVYLPPKAKLQNPLKGRSTNTRQRDTKIDRICHFEATMFTKWVRTTIFQRCCRSWSACLCRVTCNATVFSPRLWVHMAVGPCSFFRLSPPGHHEFRPGHQVPTCELPYQAWLQNRARVSLLQSS